MGFGNPSPGDIRPRQRHRDELSTSQDCGRAKYSELGVQSLYSRGLPARRLPEHEERHAFLDEWV